MPKSIIYKLLKGLKEYKTALTFGFLFLVLATLSTLYTPLIIKQVISTLIKGLSVGAFSFKSIQKILVIFIIIELVRVISNGINHYLFHIGGYGLLKDLRMKVFGHLQKLSISYHDKAQSGRAISRITHDITEIEPFIAHTIPNLAANILLFVIAFAIMFYIKWDLSLLVLLTCIPVIYIILYGNKKIKNAYVPVYENMEDATHIIHENLIGIRIIQSFTKELSELIKFKNKSEAHYISAMQAIRILSFLWPSVQFLTATGTIAIIWFGSYQVYQGKMQIEDIVAFIMYIGIIYQPLINFSSMIENVTRTSIAIDRVYKIIDEKIEIINKPNAIIPKSQDYDVCFKDVWFRYKDKGEWILKGINLTIPQGKMIALVGTTGAGKTTIANLIPRFYDPIKGIVTLGEYNVTDLDLHYLRKQISIVHQDTFLFSTTIRENIAYAKDTSIKNDEVEYAAKLANAHDFIMEFPDKYDTIVGERGITLSGGQRQRIAIARALLKNAPILILDEATSSLDTETEQQIKEAMERLLKGRTSLVIAHRLSTVYKADTICVIDKGQVIEQGTHKELIEKKGIYTNLYNIFSGINADNKFWSVV